MKFKIHTIEVGGHKKAFFRVEAQTWVSVCIKAHDKLIGIKANDKYFTNWRIKSIERETDRSIP